MLHGERQPVPLAMVRSGSSPQGQEPVMFRATEDVMFREKVDRVRYVKGDVFPISSPDVARTLLSVGKVEVYDPPPVEVAAGDVPSSSIEVMGDPVSPSAPPKPPLRHKRRGSKK